MNVHPLIPNSVVYDYKLSRELRFEEYEFDDLSFAAWQETLTTEEEHELLTDWKAARESVGKSE